MNEHSPSRRSALRGLGYVLGAGVVSLDWPALARAAHEAHQVAQSTAPATFNLLAAADAADVDALCAQIVPTDDTPGARETGAVIFIDRALGSFFAHWREGFMAGLREFQSACRARHPDAASFAALASERQIEFRFKKLAPRADHRVALSITEHGGDLPGEEWFSVNGQPQGRRQRGSSLVP